MLPRLLAAHFCSADFSSLQHFRDAYLGNDATHGRLLFPYKIIAHRNALRSIQCRQSLIRTPSPGDSRLCRVDIATSLLPKVLRKKKKRLGIPLCGVLALQDLLVVCVHWGRNTALTMLGLCSATGFCHECLWWVVFSAS